jgi:protein-tyrosine phosphatase
VPSSRDLSWDGCVNVRDLGGHPTEDGGETRFRAVVRADSVRQLSEAGWTALVEYGVRTIIDLRWFSELEADPPGERPVEVVHVSLLGDANEMEGLEAVLERIEDPIDWRVARYREFLARFRPRFAAAVAAVARAGEGTVLVHCAGGVDRTGLVTALLLRLAGVSRADVAADYGASEPNWAPTLPRWVEEADDETEREFRRKLSVISPETMLRVLEELETAYGSVRNYLLAEAADPEDLDRLRARLRA